MDAFSVRPQIADREYFVSENISADQDGTILAFVYKWLIGCEKAYEGLKLPRLHSNNQ